MLTRFIKLPDVKAKLLPLRPRFPRRINITLRAAPRTNHHTLVGTALDYLLRFELHRRAPQAITAPLAAEFAPDVVWQKKGTTANWMTLPGIDERDFITAEGAAQKLAGRLKGTIAQALVARDRYIANPSPSAAETAELAAHAIRLAKLENLYRATRYDPTYADADPEDVQDVLALLAIVPFDRLIHPTILLLNPSFGESSRLVHGADADLITGDLLIEIKTRKEAKVESDDLDQLLGYFLLARRERSVCPDFPAINRVGVYFSRHGHLWTAPATAWTGHPLFADLEPWFIHQTEVWLQ